MSQVSLYKCDICGEVITKTFEPGVCHPDLYGFRVESDKIICFKELEGVSKHVCIDCMRHIHNAYRIIRNSGQDHRFTGKEKECTTCRHCHATQSPYCRSDAGYCLGLDGTLPEYLLWAPKT